MTRARMFGPRPAASGGTQFRLWAPAARSVDLITRRTQPMQRTDNGWYELTVSEAGPGTRYSFRIDGEVEVPDPASAFQPDDVPGPSEVIDHRYDWQTKDWRGRPWHVAAILELHVGTFTPGGTFRAAIDELDQIVDTGFTAIELMPIADFAGRWNWGYDGVLWYAPDSAYGRPEDLMALIDAAHARGLMVFLDVVYNHFGPEGNFIGRYAPEFFAADTQTPWGAAIDYRVPEVRAFAIENALYWLHEFRFDGLRLDAVHAITEAGEPPLLDELSRAVGALARETDRLIHLVLENDHNQASWLDPLTDPPQGRYRAQWDDDFHHAWHVFLTGEERGYYIDYATETRKHIARTLASGFAYQGEPSTRRQGRARGEPSGGLSPLAFINFLQNHDQIGNRPLGGRLTTQADPRALAAALAIMLLAPMPPLLFMGEEWDSQRPFPFFCDFDEPLAEAVRAGRRKEFRHDYAAHAGDIPDPLAETTFRAAKLDWDARATEKGRSRLALVHTLLAIRSSEIVPHLAGARFGGALLEGATLSAHWQLGNGARLNLLANLSETGQTRPEQTAGRVIFGGTPGASLVPYAVHWAIGDA